MTTPSTRGEVTQALAAIRGGDDAGHDRLLRLVYAELRRVASNKLRHRSSRETMQPTGLVSEAYTRLLYNDLSSFPENRNHFFWAAARAMHRILIERARNRAAGKRGGGWARCDLSTIADAAAAPEQRLSDTREAVERLRAVDARAATIVMMRYFLGMSHPQVAEALDVSPATVGRDWKFAQAWLHRELSEGFTTNSIS